MSGKGRHAYRLSKLAPARLLICCPVHNVDFPEWTRNARGWRVKGYCYMCNRDERDLLKAMGELGIPYGTGEQQETIAAVEKHLGRRLLRYSSNG